MSLFLSRGQLPREGVFRCSRSSGASGEGLAAISCPCPASGRAAGQPGGRYGTLSPPIPAPAAHGCESPMTVERQKGMLPSSPEGLRPFGTAPSDSPPCKDTSKSDKRGVRAALLAHLPPRGSCRGSPFSRSGSMLRAQRSAMPEPAALAGRFPNGRRVYLGLRARCRTPAGPAA